MPFPFHPAACLLAWCIAAAGLPWLNPTLLLAGLVLPFLAGHRVLRHWARLLRRVRWLLVTLFAILAYGTPGDAWLDQAWAPTEAGLHEAGIHVLRLVLMLGGLAWLFERLRRPGLVAGLWALLRPLQRLGVDADRLAVRLSLVLDHVEQAPPKGGWRHLLEEPAEAPAGPEVVRVELPAWRLVDASLPVGTLAAMVCGVLFI